MAGIYRRGKVYHARAQRNGVEHRRTLETADRRVAERRFKQWLADLEASAWGERPRIAFREAVKQFMTQHFPTLKPRSAVRYGLSLKWLADTFDGRFLDEINRATLSDFEERRRSAGVTASTIRRDLACLSSLLSFCQDKDWVEEGGNPVPAYVRRRARRGLKEGHGRTRWLSHAEEDALLALAARKRHSKGPIREAIMLAIDTGLRSQELFSLTWPQVDLDRNVITTTRDTKNGRARVVPFQARSAAFLGQWKAAQSAQKSHSLFVFSKGTGARFRTLYRGFKILASQAGIPEVCWHDLRRTAGCRWLQDHRKRMEEVSVLLGHSSITVTERHYAFLDQMRVAHETAAQNPAHGEPDSMKLTGNIKHIRGGQNGF